MSGGMPHHWEKGEINLLIEQELNTGRATLWRILRRLRVAGGSQNWVSELFPGFEGQRAMRGLDGETGIGVVDHFCRHWLGKRGDVGPGEDWEPEGGPRPDRTGYWVSYVGEVEQIVRTTLTWAIELALGIGPDHDEDPPGVPDPPHRIELFNVCEFPWFEGWVVRRPVVLDDAPDGAPALVTVCWLTPANAASHIAASPVAPPDADVAATVPFGPARPSTEDDYELLGEPHPLAGRPVVPAPEREYATWLVTHRSHEPSTDERWDDDTTVATPFGEWDRPRTVFVGRGEIVVVSPSLPAGGVTHDGEVRS